MNERGKQVVFDLAQYRVGWSDRGFYSNPGHVIVRIRVPIQQKSQRADAALKVHCFASFLNPYRNAVSERVCRRLGHQVRQSCGDA